MSYELPRPARKALARQAAGEAHPSPALLSAYLEQALGGGEKERITNHLAACRECREVVFLASDTAEQQQLTHTPPSRNWLHWRWTVSAVALLAVVSVVLVQHYRTGPAPGKTLTLTGSDQAPEIPATIGTPTELAQQPASRAPISKSSESSSARHLSLNARNGAVKGKTAAEPPGLAKDTAALGQLSGSEIRVTRPAATAVAKSKAPTPDDVSRAAGSQPAASMDIAPDALVEASPTTQAPLVGTPIGSSLVPTPQAGVAGGAPVAIPTGQQRMLASARLWRVTPEGHVERFNAQGNWTRTLADQPTTFHVVALVGNNVWAGGDHGGLFHSVDGGEHWTELTLAADGKVEDGAIVRIRFDSPQQGTVTTQAGSFWLTSDGGQTWVKR